MSTASYWLYLGIHDKKKFYLGSFAFALHLGIRPTDIAIGILIPFIALARIYYDGNEGSKIWRKELIVFLKVMVIFGVTVLFWLLPTVYFSGGWTRYYSNLVGSYERQLRTHGIFPDQRATMTEIIQKNRAIYNALFRDSFGLGYWGDIYKILPLPIILLGFLFYLLKSDISDRRNQFLLLWFISFFAWVFPHLITTVYSRYLLPIVVPFFLMYIWGMKTPFEYLSTRFKKRGIFLKDLLVSPLLISMFVQSAYSVNGLHTIPSPFTQVVEYVQTNYSPEDVVVIVREERMHFEFLAPEYEIIDAPHFESLVNDLVATEKTILVTYTVIKWHYILEEDCQLLEEFHRAPRIYPKNSYTAIYLYIGA
ncbi:hypothetical protein [Candidatus Borrarchaeum sp.]|uniref:hypothetical protein n=1 Tax=Candidatus Borrarchaeum sp. TaxID=2846742 RepID=UPI00257EA2E8|nr:hypothetical protein [Candidatus Borrarchaeum sp.]